MRQIPDTHFLFSFFFCVFLSRISNLPPDLYSADIETYIYASVLRGVVKGYVVCQQRKTLIDAVLVQAHMKGQRLTLCYRK